MTRCAAAQRGGAALPLLCVLALVAAAAGVWYFAPHWLPKIIADTLPPSPNGAGPALYKWRDAKGALHVTDVPPAQGVRYETVRYDPKVNVVPNVLPPGTAPPKHND